MIKKKHKKGTGKRPKGFEGQNFLRPRRVRGLFGPRLCPTCDTRRYFRVLDDADKDVGYAVGNDTKVECVSCLSRGTVGGLVRIVRRRRLKTQQAHDMGPVHKVVSPESYKARMRRMFGQKTEV